MLESLSDFVDWIHFEKLILDATLRHYSAIVDHPVMQACGESDLDIGCDLQLAIAIALHVFL